ncbi:MAG: recombination protein RecR [Candidatus Latescibacteria bacterium]|nr:recombination protein RecR [Candidatus Latescibacterota bacterium]
MQYSSRYLEDLVEQLAKLPGIGRKTAQRLAFHLLRTDREEALALARAIERVRTEVGTCARCGNVAETQPCYLCGDDRRDATLLCVVEQPGDVVAFERTGAFRGLYHILRGSLSPVDGIGPSDLRVVELIERVKSEGVQEVILALNPTAQGEATSHLLAELLDEAGVDVSRIARGVPMGSEIELSDQATLSRALEGRRRI